MKNLLFKTRTLAILLLLVINCVDKVKAQRDPFSWPFTTNSIWNMPIGSNAVYQPAGFKPVTDFPNVAPYWQGGIAIDDEPIILSKSTDPLMSVYLITNWSYRCGTTLNSGKQIRFPSNLSYPDPNGSGNTPNYSGAVVQPDGSLWHFNAIATCGNNKLAAYDYTFTENNTLTSTGHRGGHGGSGLSGIGGSIRKGELLSSQPIRHAIKLNVLGSRYLVYNNDGTPGYRWPAVVADSYANPANDPTWGYGTSNSNNYSYMEIGALVAIKPDVTPQSLGISNPIAIKIFYALQDYGAYIVDDTHWNHYDIPLEEGVVDEVLNGQGTNMRNTDPQSQYFKDMMKIITNLHAITNNSSSSIGGGGTPRKPLAPPFTAPATKVSGTIIGTSGSWNNNPAVTKEKAMDANLSTYFDAPSANANWVGLDLGTAKTIVKVNYAPRTGWAGRMLGGKIQGSNSATFSTATDLFTIWAIPAENALTTAFFYNTTAFRYIRYLSPDGGYGNIAELEFWENSASIPVTGVTISPTSSSLAVGSTLTLTATVSPSNATNKNVSWSTSNSSIATVSSSGVVTGVAVGTATITVTTQDGNKTATCTITVTASSSSKTIIVFAAGKTNSEIMQLKVNGNLVQTWNNIGGNATTPAYVEYSFNATGTVSTVEVHFTNDDGPKDLRIDKIRVANTDFQAESAESFDAWGGSSCNTPGNETLWCSGYKKFTIPSNVGTRFKSEPIKEIEEKREVLSVFPNPLTSGTLTIMVRGMKSYENSKVIVINTMGDHITSVNLKADADGNATGTLDRNNLPSSGIYFTRFKGKITRILVK
jgi:uncharacterized protein YjdB